MERYVTQIPKRILAIRQILSSPATAALATAQSGAANPKIAKRLREGEEAETAEISVEVTAPQTEDIQVFRNSAPTRATKRGALFLEVSVNFIAAALPKRTTGFPASLSNFPSGLIENAFMEATKARKKATFKRLRIPAQHLAIKVSDTLSIGLAARILVEQGYGEVSPAVT